MNTTSEFPSWFRQYNSWPVANGRWIKVKLPADQRQTLIGAQRAFDETMAQRSGKNPIDEAKECWRRSRDQYNRTRNPDLLIELDRLGYKGQLLATQLRDRLHQIRDAARRIAVAHGCAPIYATCFKLAMHEVLARVYDTEVAEKQSNEMLENNVYEPSQLIRGPCNLASYYKTEVTAYENWQGDTLQPPSQVLGDLWFSIKNDSKGRK